MNKAKIYLQKIKTLDRWIATCEAELDEIERGERRTSWMDERVQTSRRQEAPFEASSIRKVDLQNKLNDYIAMREVMRRQIDCLDVEPMRDILIALYVHYSKYPTLKIFAADTGRSYDHVRHLHGDALEAFRHNVPERKWVKFRSNNTKSHKLTQFRTTV